MNKLLTAPPTVADIKAARLAAGLTQAQVAELVGLNWQAVSYAENDHRPLPLAAWSLFLLATGQHSGYALKPLQNHKRKKAASPHPKAQTGG